MGTGVGGEKKETESHVIAPWVVYIEDSKGVDTARALAMEGREERSMMSW